MSSTRNVIWLALDQLIRLVLGFAIGALVARHLGPDNFGQLAFSISLAALFASIASFGLDSILLNELVSAKSDRFNVIATVLTIKLSAAVIIGVVSSILFKVGAWSSGVSAAVVQILLWSNVAAVFTSFSAVLLFNGLASRIAASNAIPLVVFAGVRVYLVAVGADLLSFAYAQALQATATSALLVWFSKRSFPHEKLQFSPSLNLAKDMLLRSWPQVVCACAIAGYMKADQVLLGMIVDSRSVGTYTAAVRISELWYVVPSFMMPAFARQFYELNKENPEEFRQSIAFAFSIAFWAAFIGAAITTLFSTRIIEMIYGRQYDIAAPILKVHIWASVFVYLGVAQEPWNIAKNMMRFSAIRAVLGLAISIALNLLLVPSFGAMGSALAAVISFAFATVVGNLIFAPTREIGKLQLMAPFRIFGSNENNHANTRVDS